MEGKKDMRKGIILSAIVFLLLLSSYAYAADFQCGCNQCHGNPPIVNTFGAPNGLAGVGFTSGSHLAHTNGTFGAAQNNVCYECHFNGMPFTSVCGNTQLQMGFSINGGSAAGTTYDGSTTLNSSWTYNGNNGTTITQNGSMTCSNIYCHSNATGGTANTNAIAVPPLTDPRPLTANTSPAWGGSYPMVCSNWTGQSCSTSVSCHLGGYIIDPTQTYNNSYRSCYFCHGSNPPTSFTKPSYPSSPHKCYGCHNYPPTYAEDQPKSNSHWIHSYWASCNACHFATTSDGMTIKDPSKHANGVYDVVPDTSALYFTTPVNFSYAPDIGGGTCSNISCHQTRGIGTIQHWSGVWLNIGRAWNSGPACYQIQFYNVSASGGTPPYTYFWDFGDGATSTDQNPTHIYPSGGVRNGTLYVRDANNHLGASGVWPTAQSVNTAPVANFAVSVYGWTITLTDLSYDTDYNSCGHSGPGQIQIMWGDIYAGYPRTTEAINLTDQPSGKIYTHTYSAQTNLPNAQIYDIITDNSNVQSQKYMGVAIPTTHTISGRVANAAGVGLPSAIIYLRNMDGTVPSFGTTVVYTDANGNYTISSTAVDGICYLVKQPVMYGHTFTPGDQTVCSASSTVNFTAAP